MNPNRLWRHVLLVLLEQLTVYWYARGVIMGDLRNRKMQKKNRIFLAICKCCVLDNFTCGINLLTFQNVKSASFYYA